MPAADREQDARDYATAEQYRRNQSRRDDANLRGPRMRTVYLTAATLLTAAALTACGTTTDTSNNTDTGTGVPAAMSQRDLTETTFGITWGNASEMERTNLCGGLILLGPERSAQEMQAGADGSTDLDWDYMTQPLTAECDNR